MMSLQFKWTQAPPVNSFARPSCKLLGCKRSQPSLGFVHWQFLDFVVPRRRRGQGSPSWLQLECREWTRTCGGNPEAGSQDFALQGPNVAEKGRPGEPARGSFASTRRPCHCANCRWQRLQQVWPQLGADRPVRLTLTDFALFGPRGPGHEFATEL